MAYDGNVVMQTLVTKTATFQSTAIDLKTGTPARGMVTRFLINSYIGVTAGTVLTASIEESDDNTTFTTLAAAPPITAGTASASKVLNVPFSTRKRYVRSVMTVSGAASLSPSVAYLADLGIARQ